MKYSFIYKHRKEFPINTLCRILRVARSSFYDFIHSSTDPDGVIGARMKLLRAIEDIFYSSRKTYGSPRVHAQLKGIGFKVSKSTVGRLMRELGLKAKKGKKYKPKTTDSSKTLNPAPDLVKRSFDQGELNKVWLSDITYVKTIKGWTYLTTVMDGHNREIIGWKLSEDLGAENVVDALRMAMKNRNYPKGVIFHSDRGSQYNSDAVKDIIKEAEFKQSMSRKGNCWDNAPMESFYDTIKCEHIHDCEFEDFDAAKRSLFEWIEVFYNRVRIHSALGYVTPACFGNGGVL